MLKYGGCLKIPVILKEQSLYAVWPNDENTDCICPLCDDGNCILNNCECYNATFGPEIIHESTDNFSLCWSDLQTVKNNSHVYFFYEVLADPSQHMTVTRKYEIAYNIIIRGELNRVKCHVTINQFMTTFDRSTSCSKFNYCME